MTPVGQCHWAGIMTPDGQCHCAGILIPGGQCPFSKHRPSGPMLSISRNVLMFVRVSVCLSVCVFTFEVPFNGLFAPTSRSRMFNIFRDSEK